MSKKKQYCRVLGIVSAVSAVVAIGACGDSSSQDGEVETANQALASASQTTAQASIFTAMFTGLDPSLTPEELAAAADGSHFESSDCATVASSGATSTWVLTNCVGTYGFVTVSGTITATYQVRRNKVIVDVHTSDLQVNGSAVSFDATVGYSVAQGSENLEVSTSASAQTTRFGELTWEGDYTVTWNESGTCMDLDGSWEAGFGRDAFQVTLNNLSACSGSCPEGTITYEGPGGTGTLEMSDGLLSWTTSRGRSESLDLTCSGQADWTAH